VSHGHSQQRRWEHNPSAAPDLDAHNALAKIRPKSNAPQEQWLAYYQRSAALYAEIAEIDRGHHHEALHWAEYGRERANEIKAQMSTQLQPRSD
jgi:hypothetical protein